MFRIRTKNKATQEMVAKFCAENGVQCSDAPGIHKDTQILTGVLFPLDEGRLRLKMQEWFDNQKWDLHNNWVLVEGNSVYSLRQIQKDVDQIKKSGNTDKITKRFYDFMHLNFTIAHYNIHGWRSEYPTWEDVKRVIRNPPMWKTDVKRILEVCFN